MFSYSGQTQGLLYRSICPLTLASFQVVLHKTSRQPLTTSVFSLLVFLHKIFQCFSLLNILNSYYGIYDHLRTLLSPLLLCLNQSQFLSFSYFLSYQGIISSHFFFFISLPHKKFLSAFNNHFLSFTLDRSMKANSESRDHVTLEWHVMEIQFEQVKSSLGQTLSFNLKQLRSTVGNWVSIALLCIVAQEMPLFPVH